MAKKRLDEILLRKFEPPKKDRNYKSLESISDELIMLGNWIKGYLEGEVKEPPSLINLNFVIDKYKSIKVYHDA